MEGIISCIKHSGMNPVYYVASASASGATLEEAKGIEMLSLGEAVNTENGIAYPAPKEQGLFNGGISSAISEEAARLQIMEPYLTGSQEIDRTTRAMWDSLIASSSMLVKKLLYGAPVLVRFHNDADGSSGAYCLYLALSELMGTGKLAVKKSNTVWLMHKGVTYSEYDAASDILISNNYESLEKPLLVLIDFGTAPESEAGIHAAEKRFDILWLDHHPVPEGFFGSRMAHYSNPWLFEGDSNYTAGFLASAFSKTLCRSDTIMIENASLIGDYSSYRVGDGNDNGISLLLDLLTSDTKLASSAPGNLTPMDIAAVLENKTRREELISYARVRLGELLGEAVKSVKEYRSADTCVYLLDFSKMRDDGVKYPLPGRFSSKLLGKLSELSGSPCVLVLHFDSYLSIRVDKQLASRVMLLEVIREMRERHPSDIISGGGHPSAASIKLSGESEKKRMLSELVQLIKARLSYGTA
jgi:RecJ-like exonuclease